MTKRMLRGEVANPIAKGHSVQNEFVKSLLVSRGTGTVVETRPQIPRRPTQMGGTPGSPRKGSKNALALVKKPTGQRSGKGKEHNASNLEVSVQSAAFAPARKGGGSRKGKVENRSRNRRSPVPQSGKGGLDPNRRPIVANHCSVRDKVNFGRGIAPGHQFDEPEPGRSLGAVGNRNWEAQGF